jgi:hypothetical protein
VGGWQPVLAVLLLLLLLLLSPRRFGTTSMHN